MTRAYRFILFPCIGIVLLLSSCAGTKLKEFVLPTPEDTFSKEIEIQEKGSFSN